MKITPLNDRGLVRLISATYHKPPTLRGIVETDDEMDILAEIEGLTSARLTAESGRSADIDPRELAWRRQKNDLRIYGDTHVNAAFTYTRPDGNRFNDGSRGAWYCSWDSMVSAAEVAFHKTRELRLTRHLYARTRYVELLADFIGDFPDLTDEPGHPALNPDIELGYPEGQNLARQLRNDGHMGLIYPSVRAPEGNCLVAFDPSAIRNVRQGAKWEIVWDGSEHYQIEGV